MYDDLDHRYGQVVGFRNNFDMDCDTVYREGTKKVVFDYDPSNLENTVTRRFLAERGIIWTISDDEVMVRETLQITHRIFERDLNAKRIAGENSGG